MILFLEFAGQGRRGGELYHRHLHQYLQVRFSETILSQLEPFPPELLSVRRHVSHSRNLVRQHQPKLVVADISSAARNYSALRLAKKQGARFLLIAQGERLDIGQAHVLKRWLIERAERGVIALADLALVNSRFIATTLEKRRDHPLSIIIAPPGLEVDRPATTDPRRLPDKIKLLFVGECSRVKGLIHLIDALPQLGHLPWKLDVVGGRDQEPTYFNAVQTKLRENNFTGRVCFHGHVDRAQLNQFYCQATILVAPSLSEGYGMVLAEAFCHGLPLVASDTAAIGKIIEDGQTGLLTPPSDSQALATAIKRLATQPELYEQMSSRSLRRSQSLSTWGDFDAILESQLAPPIQEIFNH